LPVEMDCPDLLTEDSIFIVQISRVLKGLRCDLL